MKKKPTTMSNEAWSALDRERRQTFQNQTPPEGSFSTKDYIRKFKVSPDRARHELRQLVSQGAISEMGRFGPTRLLYFEFSS